MCSNLFFQIREYHVCVCKVSHKAFLLPLSTRLLCLVVSIPVVCWLYMCACVCVPLYVWVALALGRGGYPSQKCIFAIILVRLSKINQKELFFNLKSTREIRCCCFLKVHIFSLCKSSWLPVLGWVSTSQQSVGLYITIIAIYTASLGADSKLLL